MDEIVNCLIVDKKQLSVAAIPAEKSIHHLDLAMLSAKTVTIPKEHSKTSGETNRTDKL